MGGEGSMMGALITLKNNRNLLRGRKHLKDTDFRKDAYRHFTPIRKKSISKKELEKIKQKVIRQQNFEIFLISFFALLIFGSIIGYIISVFL